MLHACVQKFDVMGNLEDFWELNMAQITMIWLKSFVLKKITMIWLNVKYPNIRFILSMHYA